MGAICKLMMALAVCMAVVMSPGAVQAQPVIDIPQIGGFAQKAASIIQQINQFKAQGEQYISMIKGYIAKAQEIVDKAKAAIDAIRSGDWMALLNMLPGELNFLALIPQMPCELGNFQNMLSDPASMAKEALKGLFAAAGSKSGSMSTSESDEIMRKRAAAVREAAASGYSLALYGRTKASSIEEVTQEVETGMTSAADQAGDYKANSEALVPMIKQITAIGTTLAAQLELLGAENVNSVSASD